MNTSPLDDCITALVKDFQVEDIWLLKSDAAKECRLDSLLNLIVIVPDAEDAHDVEKKARDLIQQCFGGEGMDVFVFPLSVITRTPRPLLIKMALTHGKNIYRG